MENSFTKERFVIKILISKPCRAATSSIKWNEYVIIFVAEESLNNVSPIFIFQRKLQIDTKDDAVSWEAKQSTDTLEMIAQFFQRNAQYPYFCIVGWAFQLCRTFS